MGATGIRILGGDWMTIRGQAMNDDDDRLAARIKKQPTERRPRIAGQDRKRRRQPVIDTRSNESAMARETEI